MSVVLVAAAFKANNIPCRSDLSSSVAAFNRCSSLCVKSVFRFRFAARWCLLNSITSLRVRPVYFVSSVLLAAC